jgi:hypothetical protein
MGSLWRVSSRGGRGGHALTRHRRHQGGGLVDGDYIVRSYIGFSSSTVTASSMMGAAGHVNEVGRGSASM